MIHDLVVFNSNNPAPGQAFPNVSEPWMDWSTCVRQMRIGFKDWLKDSESEGVQGRQAYELLLEVICGLHSPMLGETEVFGQFRERVLKSEEHPRLAKLGLNLISDAKRIRDGFLTNLGANSYGSLTRKYTKSHCDVAIFGSGQLAREILPWMKDKTAVKVLAREAQKKDFTAFKNVEVLSLEAQTSSTALVIAAPVESADLKNWVVNFGKNISLVIDLRETSSRDGFSSTGISTVVLQDLFSELNSNQEQIRERIDLAKAAIQKISEERLKTQEIRPFGWDDICA
jgi:glutamyl-tRNA reductase